MGKKIKVFLVIIGIPLLYALITRILFGLETGAWSEFLSVMTVSFLFILPGIVGALTVYLSSAEKAKSILYRICTLIFQIEGWACWIMILPVFFIIGSLGGLVGGYLKCRKRNDTLNISILVFIPFIIAPLENLIETIPGTYKAYTYIDINAPAEKIWDNVTRVETIEREQDTGHLTRFLGFPRPVKAELNYEGVGAYREAIFTNGLVFHETVTEYEDNKKMVFTIKAYPHEIPSTTLDEHVVIGGDYFDVLNGTYELEQLANGRHRLHLYSHFRMNTTFNFYAGWWGKWIMKDIQNNILKVEKQRSEAN